MKRNKWKNTMQRWIAACLFPVLCGGLLPSFPVLAAEGDGTIHIQTQADLEALAENCRLDTWSQGKTVVLDNDLTLDEKAGNFLPIPTFGGVFEGGNHTISGLSLEGEVSRAGFFDTVQSGGVVRELTIVGQADAGGEGDTLGGIAGKNYGKIVDCGFEGTVQGSVSVGGLVGINETTGQLIGCTFQGTVIGEHYVGGIAGQNTGSLIQCENTGDINTTAIEVSADFSDLSLLRTTESVPAGTDIGGIAGFSSGVIQSCQNMGSVGYEHMGYNVGGIVGRQSGYVDGCGSTGKVQGRKDVGGIAGQLEPQVTLRYDKDLLDRLWGELDILQGLTDQAAADAERTSGSLSGSVNSLLENVGSAKEAVSGLSGAMTQWGNEAIGQVNDVSARLSWVLHRMEPVMDAASNASAYMEECSSLLAQAARKLQGLGGQGSEAASELQAASQELQKAADHGENSLAHLHNAQETAKGGLGSQGLEATIQTVLTELQAAETEMQAAKDALGEALSHADRAGALLEKMGGTGSDALKDLEEGSNKLSQAVSFLGEASGQMGEIVGVLAEEPAISFSPVDSDVTSQGDALDAALSQVLNSASGLNDAFSSSSDALMEDLRKINEQIGTITECIRQNLEETKEKDLDDSFQDVSDEAGDEAALGKIQASDNSGEVLGDINVGGVVGSLSVEYDFDPEDDLTKDGTRSLNFQYKTLAVVTGCVNEGTVSAKKNYAGGTVGRMDLGAVKACESYGDVESASGDYVGGIAGFSRASVRDCFVKCTLSGGDYIGGIIGSGEKSSAVSGCCTLVEIPESGRYCGAVSGTETGEFSGNCYVSDTLAGLGRISYAGKAEPISFSELAQKSGVPERMTRFTLRFLVEGEEVKSQTFSYGDSFGPEVFPEIPQKEGCYAVWDADELTELHFDKTVTAEYCRYVLALPSEAERKSGRPVFLMEGDFDDEAVLTAVKKEEPDRVKGGRTVEQWQLKCSDPQQKNYTLRYLSPEESSEGFSVFVKKEGQWEKASCSAFGSYLVFSVPAAETEVAIVSNTSAWVKWIAIAAGVLALLVLFLVIKRVKRKKGTQPRQEKEEKEKPQTPETNPSRKEKKKKWMILASALAVLGIAAVLIGSWMAGAVDACQLLVDFADKPEYAMTLSVDTQLEGEMDHRELEIAKTQVEDHDVICVQDGKIALYYADGVVIMENGKAYHISDLHPDYSQLLSQTAELFQKVDFSTDKSGGKRICRLKAEGEDAQDLLKMLLPEQREVLPDTQKLTVELTVQDGEILSLQFDSKGRLTDEAKTDYTISAKLQPQKAEKEPDLPEAVKEAVLSEKTAGEAVALEDLCRLLTAWTDRSQGDGFSADLLLGVEWGPISLHEKMKWEQLAVDGQNIGSIRKDDLAVYFSQGTFCDQDGRPLATGEGGLVDRARLLEVLYQVCMEGDFHCADTGNDTWLYTLTLDGEGIKKVAYAAAPDMEGTPLEPISGSVQILLKGTEVSEIDCSCTAGLGQLADAAPATVSARMVFGAGEADQIPQAVKDQLIREGMAENDK